MVDCNILEGIQEINAYWLYSHPAPAHKHLDKWHDDAWAQVFGVAVSHPSVLIYGPEGNLSQPSFGHLKVKHEIENNLRGFCI